MCVRVPDDHVEDHGVEKLQDIHSGPCSDAAEQREAILEGRAAFARVFGLRRHAERLAEVLLMDSAHEAIVAEGAVITLDQQEPAIANDTRLDRGDVEADGGGKAHDKGLVLGRRRQTRYRRLENMCGRLARRRQGHRPVHQNHRRLRLRAGEREAQPLLAREQRAEGQRVQHPDQAGIVKRGWLPVEGQSGRWLARRQKLERACDIAAEAIKKGEIIGARDAERLSRGVALAFLRQETAEKRAALAASKRLRPLWQRGGQGLGRLVVDPGLCIGEAEFTVLVLGQLTHPAPLPPDVEGARHGF